MRVIINGEATEIPDGLLLRGLLDHLGLEGPVAVEVNREIVPRVDHPTHEIRDGDSLEIVHFVGGG